MSSAKKEKKINPLSKIWARLTGTSHLPARGQHCQRCGPGVDHHTCYDTSHGTSDASPQIALHDAALRVTGEAA